MSEINTSKILIVDDEQDLVEAMRYRLELEGYEVVSASNGFEALGAFELHGPDIVLLDVMMPLENGYRVSRTIREREAADGGRSVPIVLLTARDLSDDPEREKMFMEYTGADLVLYKPCDMDHLLGHIEELLK